MTVVEQDDRLPTKVRAGYGGARSASVMPAVTGKGIGVAVVDSGISPHRGARRQGRGRRSASCLATRSTSDAFGHGTHIAGIIAGAARRHRRDRRVRGRRRARGAPGQRPRPRRRWAAGYDQQRHRRHSTGSIANRVALQHPRRQPVARPPRDRPVRHRPAVHRRWSAWSGPASSSWRRPATAARRPTGKPVARHASPRRATRRSRSRSARSTPRAPLHADDDTVTTYSSRGPAPFDLAREARRGGARQQDRLARGAGRLPRDRTTRTARGRQRHQRLLHDERHQHGRGDGERRRRTAGRGGRRR